MAELRSYICCLRNRENGGGLVAELFYTDPAEAQKFKQKYDKPGVGIYDCISKLVGDRRCKENVGQVDYLVVDIDTKDLVDTSINEIILRLTQCLLQPTEIRVSGHGVHAVLTLKEPLEGPGDLAHAETVLQRLIAYFCGDLAVSHFAALLRSPETHNSKGGAWVKCEPVAGRGPVYDLIDIEDGLDDVEARPLFTCKQKATNGHGAARAERSGGPLDVDACLEAMEPTGAGANDAQPRAILSLLQTGMHPADVVEKVVDATMQMAERNRLGWTRGAEVIAVTRRVASGLNVLHHEYAPDTRTVPPWLAGEFHTPWADALVKGMRPQLTHRAGRWYVRAYGHDKEDAKAKGEAPTTPGDTAGPAPRFKLLRYRDLRPGISDQDYLIDELLPAEGIVMVWGKFKCLKTFLMYDMMLYIAKGWEYRDRATRQGLVIYCAFEGAHGFPKRTEAQRRHYKLAEDDDVPLRVMACPTNLIKDHQRLIVDLRCQLDPTEKPAVVVLDTLNRSLVGSEGKDVDMAAYIAAASAVREAFRCLVLIIHHCGWDETRPRGHSSLPGAVDGQFAVTRDGDNVTLLVEFLRDGPEGATIHNTVKVVEVGQDVTGKVLTSLVVTAASGATWAGARAWPRALHTLHRAIKTALATGGEEFQANILTLPVRAAPLETVRTEFYATYPAKGDTPEQRQDNKKHAFSRSVTRAQEMELIRLREPEGRPAMVWFAISDTTYDGAEG
jgi:hypothetical protein